MPSLSFDPVASAYDATRGYPAGIDREIVRQIAKVADATPQTRFLEVGVGTGRIAFPLASLGHIYTGVDIAEKMVEQLIMKLRNNSWREYEQAWGALPDENSAISQRVRRFVEEEKHALFRLVIADMTALPFYDAAFDAVLAVHVFHLVDGWQQGLREILRVIRPGGVFLHCGDDLISKEPLSIKEQWEKILQELGGKVERPGSGSHVDITNWLREQGLQPQESRVVRWESTMTPRKEVESVTKRLWSGTWRVSENLFAASAARLEKWALNYFGDTMDTPYTLTREFVIEKTVVK